MFSKVNRGHKPGFDLLVKFISDETKAKGKKLLNCFKGVEHHQGKKCMKIVVVALKSDRNRGYYGLQKIIWSSKEAEVCKHFISPLQDLVNKNAVIALLSAKKRGVGFSARPSGNI